MQIYFYNFYNICYYDTMNKNLKSKNLKNLSAYFRPSIATDGVVFKKGDFITYEPNSSHSSYTKKGCLILTFMRGHNNQIKKK